MKIALIRARPDESTALTARSGTPSLVAMSAVEILLTKYRVNTTLSSSGNDSRKSRRVRLLSPAT